MAPCKYCKGTGKVTLFTSSVECDCVKNSIYSEESGKLTVEKLNKHWTETFGVVAEVNRIIADEVHKAEMDAYYGEWVAADSLWGPISKDWTCQNIEFNPTKVTHTLIPVDEYRALQCAYHTNFEPVPGEAQYKATPKVPLTPELLAEIGQDLVRKETYEGRAPDAFCYQYAMVCGTMCVLDGRRQFLYGLSGPTHNWTITYYPKTSTSNPMVHWFEELPPDVN